MNTLNHAFVGMFLALAALFALGVTPRFAARFYPTSPALSRRLAAPVIFALLAVACLAGWTMEALSGVVIAGLVLIIVSRRKARKTKTSA